MDSADVNGGEMAGRELSEAELLELLTESPDRVGPEHPVASFFADARDSLRSVDVGTPSPALSEYLNVGKAFETDFESEPSAEVIDLDAQPADRPNRAKLASAVAAFIGTVAGKIVIGGTVALAATAGAHAAGVVDVPILPDLADPVVVETTTDDAPPTTELDVLATTATTATTVASVAPIEPPAPQSTPTPTATPAVVLIPTPDVTPATNNSTLLVFPIDGVGSITVRLTQPLELLDATPDPGWAVDVDSEDDEIELNFTRNSTRVEVEYEYEDGLLRIRVKTTPSGNEETFWFDPVDGTIVPQNLIDDHDDPDSDDDDDPDDGSGSDDNDDDNEQDDDEQDDDDSDDDDDDDSDSDDGQDDDNSDDDDEDDSDSDGKDKDDDQDE